MPLGEMIARHEAEFAGRLIQGPKDVQRWRAEPADGLCWGVLGVKGFDALVRQAGDLDRLASLLTRGVRVFQLVETGASVLGGSTDDQESRGLSDLGRLFLDRLCELAPAAGRPGPRPAVDLAGLNGRTTADVLDWFEADASRRDRLVLVRSHGSIDHPGAASASGLTGPNLERLRAWAGYGLSCGHEHFASPDALRSAIEAVASRPFEGRVGYEGIGIGTDFLNVEHPLEGLGNVEGIATWLEKSFGPEAAHTPRLRQPPGTSSSGQRACRGIEFHGVVYRRIAQEHSPSRGGLTPR